MRQLTVYCSLGLSNRLQVLISGRALAEASERQFCMLWPRTAICGAPFDALFENEWNVHNVEVDAVANLPYISGWFDPLPDLLSSDVDDLVIGYPTWLLCPDRYPAHRQLQERCHQIFSGLLPVEYVQNRVGQFQKEHFRDTMIGVHLRRDDFLRVRPDVAGNTEQAVHSVDKFLDENPDAGILLCTDDGAANLDSKHVQGVGVRQQFIERYGTRVVQTAPRSLDRWNTEAIQDALMDLWLLRTTQFFVGTASSTFSAMAVWGRDIPNVITAASIPSFRNFEKVAHWTGLFTLVTQAGLRDFGQVIPFSVLLNYYFHTPRRVASRLLKNIAPNMYQKLRIWRKANKQ